MRAEDEANIVPSEDYDVRRRIDPMSNVDISVSLGHCAMPQHLVKVLHLTSNESILITVVVISSSVVFRCLTKTPLDRFLLKHEDSIFRAKKQNDKLLSHRVYEGWVQNRNACSIDCPPTHATIVC